MRYRTAFILGMAAGLLLVALLVTLLVRYLPPEPLPEPTAILMVLPTATTYVFLTATPTDQLVGSPVVKPTKTPQPTIVLDQLPMATSTRVPSTTTPVPSATPTPNVTPPVQKGENDGRRT